MNRRDFIIGAAAAAGITGCASAAKKSCACAGGCGGRILFGACRSLEDAALMKSVGYDFIERDVESAFNPNQNDEWWKRQLDVLRNSPLPIRSCNGFIPGRFRLTGPKADQEPALRYAEIALRRAAEYGTKTIVFGSGGARNVPGDYTAKARDAHPDVERGVEQYTEFCRKLCERTADLGDKAVVVIEPLRPNESNIVNFVWQGVQICHEVDSPRLNQLADIFHMQKGHESAESIVLAGKLLKHCHIASSDRKFPGSNPAEVVRLVPYFNALKKIGYTGGVSCECGWGNKANLAKELEIALTTMQNLV